MSLASGQQIRPTDFPATVIDVENTAGTTASGTYVETLTGGVPCGVAFVAPTSGRVEIALGARAVATGSASVYMSVVVRTGGVVGSGSTVLAAADANAVINQGTNPVRAGVGVYLTGLTAGATYNARQAFRTDGGTTGTFSSKTLAAKPLT